MKGKPKRLSRKDRLDILIQSQELMRVKGHLTDHGISYLNGLKQARDIIYPKGSITGG